MDKLKNEEAKKRITQVIEEEIIYLSLYDVLALAGQMIELIKYSLRSKAKNNE